MKKITISDVLKLDVLQGHRLAAGENGLSNEVNYINIYDNPISETDAAIQLFRGDIFLTFFYYGQDNLAYIMQTLKFLVESGASGLIIFDEYLNTLPQEALEYCNQSQLPIIFLDCTRPYSLVISKIMELKIASEQRRTIEDKLISIANGKLTQDELQEMIYDLNPHFQKNVITFFISVPDDENLAENVQSEINLINSFNRNQLFFASQFQNGILLLLSFSESRSAKVNQSIEDTIKLIDKFFKRRTVGISNPLPLDRLGTAISQCYLAVGTGQVDERGLVFYRELGISRILLNLLGSEALESFYADVITPLKAADEEHHGEFIQTMLMFVENDMDYKKTSKALFVHENTIRYRISKIKTLIPYGKSEIDFYETMSIISKVYKMKQFSS